MTRCSNSYTMWHLKIIHQMPLKLIKRTWGTHSSLWVWILHLGGAGGSPLTDDECLQHSLNTAPLEYCSKKWGFAACVLSCSQSALTSFAHPGFFCTRTTHPMPVSPHDIAPKRPTPSPQEEHPAAPRRAAATPEAINSWDLLARRGGKKVQTNRSHEAGSSHLQGQNWHTKPPTKKANTNPCCEHRLGCCYRPSNNRVVRRRNHR